MSKVKGRQKGFTLVEVLVILAILAILAGVLIPAVTNQVTKADAERAANDLTNVRTGVEAFLVDVKRYPANVAQLVRKPLTGEDDIRATDIPDGLIAKWAGPYVSLADTTSTTNFMTGFGGYLQNDLDTVPVGSISYATVIIKGVSKSDFYKVDARIDGDTGVIKGRLRWAAGTTSASDSIKFLAVPIN